MPNAFINLDQEQVSKLEKKLRLGGPYGQIVINEDLKIVIFNRAICSKLKYHESTLKGMPFRDILPVKVEGKDGNFRDWHDNLLKKWFLNPFDIKLQERIGKDGKTIYFSLLDRYKEPVYCKVAIRCESIENSGSLMYDAQKPLRFGVADIFWIEDFTDAVPEEIEE